MALEMTKDFDTKFPLRNLSASELQLQFKVSASRLTFSFRDKCSFTYN